MLKQRWPTYRHHAALALILMPLVGYAAIHRRGGSQVSMVVVTKSKDVAIVQTYIPTQLAVVQTGGAEIQAEDSLACHPYQEAVGKINQQKVLQVRLDCGNGVKLDVVGLVLPNGQK